MGAFRGFVNKKFDVPIVSVFGVQIDLGQAFNKFVQAVCGGTAVYIVYPCIATIRS